MSSESGGKKPGKNISPTCGLNRHPLTLRSASDQLSGQPLYIQQAIQTQRHVTLAGAHRALAQIDVLMDEYRALVDGSNLADFHHRAYRFDRLLPLVACGGFMPELAIDGTRLQHLARGTAAFEQLENIYLLHSWWSGLPGVQKADLGERIHAGVALNPRTPGAYSPNSPPLATAGVVKSTRS
jgi:hypothetical protein